MEPASFTLVLEFSQYHNLSFFSSAGLSIKLLFFVFIQFHMIHLNEIYLIMKYFLHEIELLLSPAHLETL